jgi:hypothetical protein
MVRRRNISVAERRELVDAAVAAANFTLDEAKAMRHHITNVRTCSYLLIPVERPRFTC